MQINNIFKNNVTRIIVENYNLCNRKCYMCPQSLGIRNETYKEFPLDVFCKMLDDLSIIEFSNTIAIGRYHEPLMYPEITLNRICRIRNKLNNVTILLNTNGDFLTKHLLKQLNMAGLTSLKIMCYQDRSFRDDIAKKLCLTRIAKLNLKIEEELYIPGVIRKYELTPYDGMNIAIKSENYNIPERGCNRGGLIKNLNSYKRRTPCDIPLKNIDIDYNCNVLPCNNLLSDAEVHQPYIMGNLQNDSIFQIYEKTLQSDFVNRITKGQFNKDKVCQGCSYFYKENKKHYNKEILGTIK